MLENFFPDFFDDNLRVISMCPSCNARDNFVETHLVGKRGNSLLLHIKCKQCFCTVLAIASISNQGVASVGIRTDLSYDDVLRFREVNSVTTDDVLATHELVNMQNFLSNLR